LFSETFESGTLGQFQSVGTGGGSGWSASSAFAHGGTFSAFAADPATVSDHHLRTSDSVNVPSTGEVTLRFWHRFARETNCDGGVLEIAVNGGPFVDILAAGSFSSGGYNGSIACPSNPLSNGRQVWTGDSGGWIQTVAVLSPFVLGKSLQFSLRSATDSTVAVAGWYVDDVSLERAPPTAVTVTSFTAVHTTRGVALRWRSVSDAGLVGFALQRDGMRLNERLIAVKGTVAGGRYGFVDTSAVPARLYLYRLQGVRIDGRRTTLGFVTVKP
jgi:hypothetical protein